MAGALTPKGEQSEFERGFTAGFRAGYANAHIDNKGSIDNGWKILADSQREESKD